MKTLKAVCTAAILALALSVPAYAGDISSPGLTSCGEIGCPGVSAPASGDIHTPGVALTTPGDIETPGLADYFWTLISML